MNLAIRVLAPQVVRSDEPALHHPRDERSRPDKGVYDVNALISERRSELRVQDVFHAADDIVHNLNGRIGDAQILRRVRQCFGQKALVQLRDYPLLARRRRHALRSDSDISVEPLQPLGLLLQSTVLERIYHALHGERDGVALREAVSIKQRVEHGLGHQMLGERPYRLVFGHAVVQVAPQAR